MTRSILKKEGIGGLYGGVRASMLKVLPMAVFSFGTYEFVRMYLNQIQDSTEVDEVRKECGRCPAALQDHPPSNAKR